MGLHLKKHGWFYPFLGVRNINEFTHKLRDRRTGVKKRKKTEEHEQKNHQYKHEAWASICTRVR